jgi:hypothetical protein
MLLRVKELLMNSCCIVLENIFLILFKAEDIISLKDADLPGNSELVF